MSTLSALVSLSFCFQLHPNNGKFFSFPELKGGEYQPLSSSPHCSHKKLFFLLIDFFVFFGRIKVRLITSQRSDRS